MNSRDFRAEDVQLLLSWIRANQQIVKRGARGDEFFILYVKQIEVDSFEVDSGFLNIFLVGCRYRAELVYLIPISTDIQGTIEKIHEHARDDLELYLDSPAARALGLRKNRIFGVADRVTQVMKKTIQRAQSLEP